MTAEDLMEKLTEARSMFGAETVREVLIMVQTVGDADSVYTEYEDMRMEAHAACVAMLYFD